MNKKILWISIASVATLGIGGFVTWRILKKRKAKKAELEANVTKQIQGEVEDVEIVEEAQVEEQQQAEPPYVEIEENVVYISAKWCPACKQNEPTAQKLYAKYKDKVEFLMLDADDELAKSYGYQLGARHIPALMFVMDGEKIGELVGPKTMEEYDAEFAKYFPTLAPKKTAPIAKPKAKPATAQAEREVKAAPAPAPAPVQEEVKALPEPSANGQAEQESVEESSDA